MRNGADAEPADDDAAAVADDSNRVYVGNLLPKAKETHLQSQFAAFGVIHNIWIARRPPGFAFVQFAKRGDALRAVEACNSSGGVEILGKAVRVQMAGEKKQAKSEAGDKSARTASTDRTSDKELQSRKASEAPFEHRSRREERGESQQTRQSPTSSRRRRYRRDRDSVSPGTRRDGSRARGYRRLPPSYRSRSRSRSGRRYRQSSRTRNRSRSRSRTRRRRHSPSRSKSPRRRRRRHSSSRGRHTDRRREESASRSR